ncbi:hypothetical protein MKX08_010128 [Trichoderma sp. CBMAI-0020]|nr:hypothetical protein MKX08_010128 [Trichoderma sp. CBMAI-0020]WOD46349.1 hypothetical protein [Trichoderma atroviride]
MWGWFAIEPSSRTEEIRALISEQEDQPQVPCGNIQKLIYPNYISETTGEEHMAKKMKAKKMKVKKMNGQASTPVMVEDRPASLQGAPENLQFVPDEDTKDAVGAAALLIIVSRMLRAIVEDPCGITEEDLEEIRKTLDFIGTEEDLDNTSKAFKPPLDAQVPFDSLAFGKIPPRPAHHWPKKPPLPSLQSLKRATAGSRNSFRKPTTKTDSKLPSLARKICNE